MSNLLNENHVEQLLASLSDRPDDSHKGTFGRVLCICGSFGMAGAAYLSALAVYRTGAGLVEVYTPEENRIILQSLLPEAILKTYTAESWNSNELQSSIDNCDSIIIGCGIGKSKTSLEILKFTLKHATVPTVIDADALNLLSEHPFLFKYAKGKIITPHVKEMSRLCSLPCEDILKSPEKTAADFSKKHELICALKNHRTAISDEFGNIYTNTFGNSGMATAGSGDVLAGVIASLLAQKHLSLSAYDAAILGVHLHAKAGDRAAEKLGKSAVMARDIANNILFQ